MSKRKAPIRPADWFNSQSFHDFQNATETGDILAKLDAAIADVQKRKESPCPYCDGLGTRDVYSLPQDDTGAEAKQAECTPCGGSGVDWDGQDVLSERIRHDCR